MVVLHLGIQDSFYAKNFSFMILEYYLEILDNFVKDKRFCGYNLVAYFGFSKYFDKSEAKALEKA